jgi:hypothetical protein
LTEAAKNIGINEQRVFEVRQIRDADPALYRKVKAGSHSLRGALAKISSSTETRSFKSDLDNSESIPQGRNWSSGNARAKGSGQGRLIAQPVGSKVGSPPSRRAIEKALGRIKEILGSWFYGEVKGRNLIQKPEEIVQFAKLTDTQMREIGSLLKRGWTFSVAFEEVIDRLTPDDQIRALQTRAIANAGNWHLSSVGNFTHIVAWGPEKDKILAKLKDVLAGRSVPHRS